MNGACALSLPVFSKGVKFNTDGGSLVTSFDRDRSGIWTPTTASPASVHSRCYSADVTCPDAFGQLQERYDILDGTSQFIGSGSGGCVWSGMHRENQKIVAIKTVENPAYSGRRLHEVEALALVQGIDGVVCLLDSFVDQDNEIIVMEFLAGGDLLHKLQQVGRFSESETREVVVCLLTTLQQVHKRGVIHRDIKPENILLSVDGKVKIADWGISSTTSNPCPFKGCLGTVGYAAPEFLSGCAHDKSIDLWSVGAVAFVLLCGSLPFQRETGTGITVLESTLSFENEAWTSVSDSAKDFIRKLMVKNPSERMTSVEALHHAWVR